MRNLIQYASDESSDRHIKETTMKQNVVFFWKKETGKSVNSGCLSQWYSRGFVVDGVYYRCAEQYMMAEMARCIKDDAACNEILSAKSSKAVKSLGRSVEGFDANKWDSVKFDVVVRGNFAKFSQNEVLKEFILSTGDALLAEASPKDKIWGIGLDAETASKTPKEKWPGKNLLGQALMRVREKLRRGEGDSQEVEANKRRLREWEERIASDKMVKAGFAKLKAPQKKQEKAKPSVVNHAKDPIPCTQKEYMYELQSAAKQMHAYVPVLDEKTSENGKPFSGLSLKRATDADSQRLQELQNKFDRLYRGFVYRQLLKPTEKGGLYGFESVDCNGEMVPMRGNLSGAEIFAAVWAKLFGVRYDVKPSARKRPPKAFFLDFDFSRENVGNGAFRAYLKEITYSVFRDIVRRDLVPSKDVHGHVLRDDRGKPFLVPKYQVEDDSEKVKSMSVAPLVSRSDSSRSRLRLKVAFLASHRLLKDKDSCPKWFRDAAVEIFERRKNVGDVKRFFVEKGLAKSDGVFDTALSRFRDKIRKLTDKLMDNLE